VASSRWKSGTNSVYNTKFRKVVDLNMRIKTPSYTFELPMQTTVADERELAIRFEANRHIYNACLGESLRRLDLMRASKEWQHARTLSKGKFRTEAFKSIIAKFGFSAYSVEKFAKLCYDSCWIGNHLGSHDLQTMSTRAFDAAHAYAFSKKGRPRFRRHGELLSIRGKSNKVIYHKVVNGIHRVNYLGLHITLILDRKDKHNYQVQALKNRIKYVRIVRRAVRGKFRYYAQLVMEGIAPHKDKNIIGKDTIGLDLGPKNLAGVSSNDAILEPFCTGVDRFDVQIRLIQRAMDRSRRANNPENYNKNGTIKKGPKKWTKSRHYAKLAKAKSDLERKLVAERRREHGELHNRILAQGNVIKLEDLSYKSWQRGRYGKSVNKHAPAEFVTRLAQKAKDSGGSITEFSTRTTKLSQYDHKSKTYSKKLLSQREHIFADGTKAQRDLYSAWLARFVVDNKLDVSQLDSSWPSADMLLQRAASSKHQLATGFVLTNARNSVRVSRPLKGHNNAFEVVDVVTHRGEGHKEHAIDDSESRNKFAEVMSVCASIEPPEFIPGSMSGLIASLSTILTEKMVLHLITDLSISMINPFLPKVSFTYPPASYNSGCWWYRQELPRRYLRSSGWSAFDNRSEDADIVHIARVRNQEAINMVRQLKSQGKKVVYDIDDNYWVNDLQDTKLGTDSNRKSLLNQIIGLSDAVIVTTKPLADVVKENTGKLAHIVPNFLEPSVFGRSVSLPELGTKPILLVSGGIGHERDFELYSKLILDRRLKDFQWLIFCPDKYKSVLSGVTYWPVVDLHRYFSVISTLGRRQNILSIVHLLDVPFNHAKSRLKWMEYTQAGIPGIYSDVGEYPGHAYCTIPSSATAGQWVERIINAYEHRQAILVKDKQRLEEVGYMDTGIKYWEDIFLKVMHG